MARNNKRTNKPKNTNSKKTPYELHPRRRFDATATITTRPEIRTRIFRTTDPRYFAHMLCRVGFPEVLYTVRFVGNEKTVDAAFKLVPGDRIMLHDAVFWGPERIAGHQEIHVPRFERIGPAVRLVGPTWLDGRAVVSVDSDESDSA